MFKRLFFALFGLGFGVVLGALFARKVQRALSPDHVARAAATRANAAAGRVGEAVRAGRRAAAEAEAELRERFLGDGSAAGA